MVTAEQIARIAARVRQRRPLIHNITNLVVANVTANCLLAVGASPAMVESPEEVAEFVALSQALVVNIGTLSAVRVQAMEIAADRAGALGIPWVLDPVGVGATSHRTGVADRLAGRQPWVVRGNASEILALAGMSTEATRGVDSSHDSGDALVAAKQLAKKTKGVIAVTGPVDYVTDGTDTIGIANGHPMMTVVTGTGCSVTALVGACLGVEQDSLAAAVAALTIFGIAGEIAAVKAAGSGSLQVGIIDALHAMDEATILARAKLL